MGDEELTDESLDQVRVLRHCGTWHVCIPRPPPPALGWHNKWMQIAKLMDYCAAEEDEWDAKFEELFESKFETFVDGEEHKIEYASCVSCALAPLLWRIAVGCNAAAQSLYRYFTAYNEYLAMFDEYLERASCPLLQLACLRSSEHFPLAGFCESEGCTQEDLLQVLKQVGR
jgi:hypothetical protein